MRFPLDSGNYSVGRDFQAHLDDPSSRAYPGQDYPSSEGTPVHAIESGYVYMRVDSQGANYVTLQGNIGLWFFVHFSRFEGSDRNVNEGDVIGYVGHTGHAFGNHLHLGLKINGNYVNPVPFLNNSNKTNSNPDNNSNNSYNNNMSEFVTIQNGWGLSNVADAAGLSPNNQDTWQAITNLNQGVRGNNGTWQSLNARMGAGDQLRVRQAIAPQPVVIQPQPIVIDPEIQILKDQIAKQNADNLNAINLIKQTDTANQTQLVTAYDLKISNIQNQLLDIQNQKNDLLNKEADLQGKLSQYQTALTVDTGIITNVTTEIIKETLQGTGLLTKWDNWIQLNIKSATLRSILKYDVFVVLGWFLSLPTIGLWFLNSGTAQKVANLISPISNSLGYNITAPSITALLVGSLGIVVKLLLTNYDTNKDGKFNLKDTQVLQNLNKLNS